MTALPGQRSLNTHFAPRNFSSRHDWATYAAWLVRHIKVSLGLLPEPARTPLFAKVFGKWTGDGYTCEKVYFESLPGFYVTGNLFCPAAKTRGKLAGILCPHGHWPNGRLQDYDPRGSIALRCINLARMGAVVFSYDMVGYNDSCQLPHRQFAGDPHWGLSLMAVQTWNSMRAVDFLLELPNVDPARIAITGASGGGTQAFILSAVDSRIAAAAPICMISYHMQGGCLCENAPLLRIDSTNVDIARLFATKPLFLGSCTGDWTKNTLTEELPAVRAVYKLYGAADQVLNHHVDYGHNYNREMREYVYGFFNKFIFGAKSAKPLTEFDTGRPPHRDLMVWWGRRAPEPMAATEFRNLWRVRAESTLRGHLKLPETVRRTLGPLLPHILGIPADGRTDSARQKPITIKAEINRSKITIRPAKSLPEFKDDEMFCTTYNRSFFAEQVREILGTLAEVNQDVTLHGAGSAGLACLAAAALSSRVRAVEADTRHFDPRKDMHWTRHLDVPSIRQIGGMATVLARIGSRPLRLINATAPMLQLAKQFAK